MSMNECSLCLTTSCSEYEVLKEESGEYTEVHDITTKYFDPIMLSSDDDHASSPIKILCKKCWNYIDEFHEFQQSIINSRFRDSGTISINLDTKSGKQLEDELDFRQEDISNEMKNMHDINSEENIVEIIIERNSGEESASIESLPDDNSISESTLAVDLIAENLIDSKLRETRKSKVTSITNTKNITTETDSKRKEARNPSRAVYTLEKGREADNFIAEWKPNLECDLCPVTATNFDMLRSHFKEVHKSRFYIKCCERKFYRRCMLVDHIRLHVNPDIHKCDICGKSSTSKYNLKLHKKIVHNEQREYECEICHKNFNHKPTLERHLLTHVTGSKEFFCKQCGKGYILEVQLNAHMRNVHNTVICDQCGKTLRSAGAFRKHLIEHGIIPQPKFRCDQCGVELKSNEALKRHIAAYHHDGTTVYVCSICGKVAASENALLSHKKFVHEGSRKHKCNFCDKAFRTPIVLREHIATHTGEDLYQCPHCPQTFKTNANMHHHRKRVHPQEWKEARKNRLNLPKVNIDQLRREVII